MSSIGVLIVDDHGLFREGLGRLLNATPGIRVVGQCSTVRQAVDLIATGPVNVVLLDYDLGEEAGTKLLKSLRQSGSELRVLMVTAGLPDPVVREVMEAGASGVFLKHSSPDQLVLAVQQVAKGEIWLDKTAVHSLIGTRIPPSGGKEQAQSLTARQADVLRGILDGLTNKEIAAKLHSSETGVKAAIQELFHKAGVRTRSQLVRIAIEKHSLDWLTR